jgi:ribosomal protein S18 acetylase RimI-like enzyme
VSVADLVAADYADRLRTFGARAPERFVAEVAGLVVVGLGVAEPWGVQVAALDPDPDLAAVTAAVAWCRERGHDPQVVVRSRCRERFPDYAVVEELGALVAPAEAEQEMLAVETAGALEEFRAVYAAAFGMRPGVAEALVVEADLAAVPHLIGRVDGRAVACAQLRIGAGRGFISGVGVMPGVQRLGYGSAMLAACRHEAGRRGCDLVWLNAGPANVPFYVGIGFALVDTHLALSPPS